MVGDRVLISECYQIGSALLETPERAAEAAEAFRKAIEQNGGRDPEAHYRLGVALVPRLAQAAVPAGAAIRPLRAPAPARHVFAATRAGAERRPTIAAVLDALVSSGSA